jgi:hypothetical protein
MFSSPLHEAGPSYVSTGFIRHSRTVVTLSFYLKANVETYLKGCTYVGYICGHLKYIMDWLSLTNIANYTCILVLPKDRNEASQLNISSVHLLDPQMGTLLCTFCHINASSCHRPLEMGTLPRLYRTTILNYCQML